MAFIEVTLTTRLFSQQPTQDTSTGNIKASNYRWIFSQRVSAAESFPSYNVIIDLPWVPNMTHRFLGIKCILVFPLIPVSSLRLTKKLGGLKLRNHSGANSEENPITQNIFSTVVTFLNVAFNSIATTVSPWISSPYKWHLIFYWSRSSDAYMRQLRGLSIDLDDGLSPVRSNTIQVSSDNCLIARHHYLHTGFLMGWDVFISNITENARTQTRRGECLRSQNATC